MNAKIELLETLKGKATIKCALIERKKYDDPVNRAKLMLNYTPLELTTFYNDLDFEYDSGYGQQQLYGTIWLTDGSWIGRGEYDGREWYEHYRLPVLPQELIK